MRGEEYKDDNAYAEGDVVYFDEQEGIYYDSNGNPINFNPEDFIIEDLESGEVFQTLNERPKSAMPTPSTHSRTLSEDGAGNKRRKLKARKAKKKMATIATPS